MLSTWFDRTFLTQQARQEGARRVRQRNSFVAATRDSGVEVTFFPIPYISRPSHRLILLDESGYHFTLPNRAGEDTILALSRISYVIAPTEGHYQYGPKLDTIYYPAPLSQHLTDLSSLCAASFGGRQPFRHADAPDFVEKLNAAKLLELTAKNNTWTLLRSLWSGGELRSGDVVLLDGSLNVVVTPQTDSADEIDEGLHSSGIILAALSKSFAPKCADIVARGRQLYSGQPFLFTIPIERLLKTEQRREANRPLYNLGPKGYTLGLPFGLVLSTDPTDLEYHGLFISYRYNLPHYNKVQEGRVVKLQENIPLSQSFIEEVLIPIGALLVYYSRGVVSANYPLPAAAVHSHVLFTGEDLVYFLEPCLAAMLEAGEHLRYLEADQKSAHEVVDGLLNRLYQRG